MYDTILIPSDGSEHAVRAAEHGSYLGRAFGSTLHLLNVVDVQAAAGLFDAGGVDEAFVDSLVAEGDAAVDAVDDVLDDAFEESGRLHRTVVRGEPSDTILEYADDHDADLIAMGTHGRTGINRYIAGSVAERVVRLADAPVLTVRATEQSRPTGDYRDVLVPTDGSELAAAAVDHGIAIAAATDARVHVVNVVDVGSVGLAPGALSRSEVHEQLVAQGEEATENVAARARDADVDVVTEVREGTPAAALCEYADDHGVDLIAMGTAGRTGLDRYLLGSTTEQVIRRARVPVLAVNARAQ
jgi:nucleotide-binding universal stress UspA family protein